VAHLGDRRGAYRVWWGDLKSNRHLGGHRHRWENNIKMDLQEIDLGVVDWIDLVQDRVMWRALVIAVMNCGVP
jgi:hypothetical protein